MKQLTCLCGKGLFFCGVKNGKSAKTLDKARGGVKWTYVFLRHRRLQREQNI